MTRWGILFLLASAGFSKADGMVLPSGLSVSFLDQFLEHQSDGQTLLTLRFLAPQIGTDAGELGYEQVEGDIDQLCDSEGMRAVAEAGPVDQVVIALMDRELERGLHDPDATMFIGAYRPTEEGCVWQ